MSPEISSDSFYMSAPSSPSRSNLDNICFYSLPASPTREMSKSTYDPETELTTPKTYEDARSNFDDFEFATSGCFIVDDFDFDFETNVKSDDAKEQEQEKLQRQNKASFPAMAFADDLFCDGKVMPLKPPPRLRYIDNKYCNYNSTRASPRSPSSMIKFPFSLRSSWNDDFDPFMVALENVTKEKNGNYQASNYLRAWCMSSLRASTDVKPNNLVGSNCQRCKQLDALIDSPNHRMLDNRFGNHSPAPASPKPQIPFPQQSLGSNDFDPATKALGNVKEETTGEYLRAGNGREPNDMMGCNYHKCNHMGHLKPNPNKQMEPNGSYSNQGSKVGLQQPIKDNPKSPIRFSEPKGLLYARQMRLVKTDQEWPRKSRAGENATKSGWPYTKENRRQKKKKKRSFLFMSLSMKKTSDEHKQKDKDVESPKPKKSSSESLGLVKCNEEKIASEMNKLTLVLSRPKLWLCMGLGAKYAQ